MAGSLRAQLDRQEKTLMNQEQALFSGKIDGPDKTLEADTESIQSQDSREGSDIQ